MQDNLPESALAAVTSSKAGVQMVWSAALTFPMLSSGEVSNLIILMVAGLFGGVARWVAEGKKVWPHGVSTIVLGIITAAFLSPLAKPLTEGITGQLDMAPLESLLFRGFISGLFGVTLIGFVRDILTAKRSKVAQESDGNA